MSRPLFGEVTKDCTIKIFSKWVQMLCKCKNYQQSSVTFCIIIIIRLLPGHLGPLPGILRFCFFLPSLFIHCFFSSISYISSSYVLPYRLSPLFSWSSRFSLAFSCSSLYSLHRSWVIHSIHMPQPLQSHKLVTL